MKNFIKKRRHLLKEIHKKQTLTLTFTKKRSKLVQKFDSKTNTFEPVLSENLITEMNGIQVFDIVRDYLPLILCSHFSKIKFYHRHRWELIQL